MRLWLLVSTGTVSVWAEKISAGFALLATQKNVDPIWYEFVCFHIKVVVAEPPGQELGQLDLVP